MEADDDINGHDPFRLNHPGQQRPATSPSAALPDHVALLASSKTSATASHLIRRPGYKNNSPVIKPNDEVLEQQSKQPFSDSLESRGFVAPAGCNESPYQPSSKTDEASKACNFGTKSGSNPIVDVLIIGL